MSGHRLRPASDNTGGTSLSYDVIYTGSQGQSGINPAGCKCASNIINYTLSRDFPRNNKVWAHVTEI